MEFRKLFTVFLILFILISCLSKKDSDPQESKTPINPYHELIYAHEAKNPELYDLSKSWEERAYNLDEIHKDYIIQMNKIDDFPDIPYRTKIINPLKRALKNIAAKEPLSLKQLKNKYIYGIYFCEKMGGTGLTGLVYSKDKKILGGYILLDANLMKMKGNDWITYKENSVFQEGLQKLKIKIEDPKNNTEESTLNYILLHELGHIISFANNLLPDQGNKYRDYENYPFSKKDWKQENISIWDKQFPQRSKIHFYYGDKIPNSEMISVYQNLEKTPFPTLYAAINANDHFAESFVSYVHIYLYKKPWILTISQDNQIIYQMENGIVQERSKREREYIEQLFPANPSL
jgi:hypothetical protein